MSDGSFAEKKFGAADHLGSCSILKGDFTGEADLHLEGRVEGTVTVKQHTVQIAQSAFVKADINARVVVVEGEITGNLRATEKVVLSATARVRGRISAPVLQMEAGSIFNGDIDIPGMREKGAQPLKAA
jgi:cytoskeletal protein CcmA (bactofilin family)